MSKQTLNRPTGSQVACENCGHLAHEHEKEKVTHQDGTYSYDYVCPDGGEES